MYNVHIDDQKHRKSYQSNSKCIGTACAHIKHMPSTHTYRCAHRFTYKSTSNKPMQAHAYTCAQRYTYTVTQSTWCTHTLTALTGTRTCTCTCRHTHTDASMHACTHTHSHTHKRHTHTHMHAPAHTCTHTCTHTRTREKSKYSSEISVGRMIAIELVQVEDTFWRTKGTLFHKNATFVNNWFESERWELECTHFSRKKFTNIIRMFQWSDICRAPAGALQISTTNIALLFTPDTGHTTNSASIDVGFQQQFQYVVCWVRRWWKFKCK